MIPFVLCVTSWWAFIASFEDDSNIGGPADPGGRWWSSTGLRLFALVPFMLAILFGRMVWKRRKRLERTVAVVEVRPVSAAHIVVITLSLRVCSSAFFGLSIGTPSSAFAHACSSHGVCDFVNTVSHATSPTTAHWILSTSVSEPTFGPTDFFGSQTPFSV